MQHFGQTTAYGPVGRKQFLVTAALLWGIMILCVSALWLYLGSDILEYPRSFLLPWCLATLAVIRAPCIYLTRKAGFDPTNPIVFAAWSYFIPGFVVGGCMLALGFSEPYYLTFVQDINYDLPMTFVYVMVGFLA